jgi:hypothetical protein
MSYAAVSDVSALVPFITISASSKPSTSQVQGYLDDCSQMIDAALSSRGVAVPITAPATFLADLKALCALGGAGKVLVGTYPQGAGPNAMSGRPTYWKDFLDRLEEFRRGLGIPVALTLSEHNNAPRGYFTDNNAIGVTDATDAWGDTIDSNPAFTREKLV